MKTYLFTGTALAMLLLTSSSFAAQKFFKADLTPDSEVTKPVGTTFGTTKGTAAFSYDDVTGRLCGQITYAGMTSAVQAAHIHEGAIGVEGNAFVSFQVGTASPIDVDELVDAADMAKVVADKMYVNVHTVNNSNGEIRGELVDDPAGTDLCPATAADAGADDAGGSSSSSSSSGSSGSSGATTTRADAGSDPGSSTSSSSCSTSPGSSSSPIVLAMGVGAAIALASRKRKKH